MAAGAEVVGEVAPLHPHGPPDMLRRRPFRAMGCDMLAVSAGPDDQAAPELELVPGWFEDWEQALSRFRLDSELSRLNRTVDQHVPVSRTLWEVYQAALWADRFTGGLVRPTVGGAVIHAGYDQSFDLLSRHQAAGAALLDPVLDPFLVIVADEQSRTICLPPGVQLDFGGVAKGWAADQATKRLAPLGPALMDAGGDIAISGCLPGGELWEVAVEDPSHPGQDLLSLHLPGCGVATSGKNRRNWTQNGLLRHHIIDPRTGLSAESDVVTATVVAPTVLEAEAAAKALLILGSEAGMAWLEAHSFLAGLLILEDGKAICNPQMQEYL